MTAVLDRKAESPALPSPFAGPDHQNDCLKSRERWWATAAQQWVLTWPSLLRPGDPGFSVTVPQALWDRPDWSRYAAYFWQQVIQVGRTQIAKRPWERVIRLQWPRTQLVPFYPSLRASRATVEPVISQLLHTDLLLPVVIHREGPRTAQWSLGLWSYTPPAVIRGWIGPTTAIVDWDTSDWQWLDTLSLPACAGSRTI